MHVHQSAFPSVPIPDVAITPYVLGRTTSQPDAPAFIEGPTGRVVTYGQLDDAIRRLAGGLQARGVGPGTTWALMAPNVPEYAIVFHGIALAGGTVTTLNPTYGAEEIAFQLEDAGASAMVTVGLFADTARDAAARAGIDTVIVLDSGTALTDLYGEPLQEQVAVDPAEHVVVLPYSSGTTGFPKGVMLTHRNLVANTAQWEFHLTLGPDDTIFAVLPFFHIYGMQVLMNLALFRGATIVTAPRFDLVEMLELVQTHGMTRLFLVPPIVLALAKHPIIDNYDLSSVAQIFSGAAPLGGELAEAAATRLGCAVLQGYGMTELSPVCHAVVEGSHAPGSVGTLVPNTEARLVDPDTGTDPAPGEPGELWIRGPQVMKGYLNNPEATAITLDAEGWLHTGDIAEIDDQGRTTIVDRLKELIKVKGFQVPPAELEALLITHPGVADVAVIGVPDDEASEVPKAFIVRVPGSDVTAQDLQDMVREHLATYKQVKHVEFVDSIPKSASGKILRRELRGLEG